MKNKQKSNEALSSLVRHITWCITQYTEEEDLVKFSTKEKQGSGFTPNWSDLRTLQNHLHYFLGHPDSEQANAVAVLLIYTIDRMFSDLCTDTPWDKHGVINNARSAAQKAILELLECFKDALLPERADEKADMALWQAFREFENKYARILGDINREDMSALTKNRKINFTKGDKK